MKRKKVGNEGNFDELIDKAQSAVANVKDDQLRGIAFGRILDHLLSDSSTHDLPRTQSRNVSKSPTHRAMSPKQSTSTGTLAWLTDLHEEGFFKEPKSLKEIVQELSNRSHRLKSTDLTWPLQKLCHDKKLRRNQQVPAEGSRKVFHWYNW